MFHKLLVGLAAAIGLEPWDPALAVAQQNCLDPHFLRISIPPFIATSNSIARNFTSIKLPIYFRYSFENSSLFELSLTTSLVVLFENSGKLVISHFGLLPDHFWRLPGCRI